MSKPIPLFWEKFSGFYFTQSGAIFTLSTHRNEHVETGLMQCRYHKKWWLELYLFIYCFFFVYHIRLNVWGSSALAGI